jgi:hypothetical protein
MGRGSPFALGCFLPSVVKCEATGVVLFFALADFLYGLFLGILMILGVKDVVISTSLPLPYSTISYGRPTTTLVCFELI